LKRKNNPKLANLKIRVPPWIGKKSTRKRTSTSIIMMRKMIKDVCYKMRGAIFMSRKEMKSFTRRKWHFAMTDMVLVIPVCRQK
jgi:hypothetical protein